MFLTFYSIADRMKIIFMKLGQVFSEGVKEQSGVFPYQMAADESFALQFRLPTFFAALRSKD